MVGDVGMLDAKGWGTDFIGFQRVMHSALRFVSGLDGDLVRPAYQTNPPPLPPLSIDWLAFSLGNFEREAGLPYIIANEKGECDFFRFEKFTCHCVFYGENCQFLAENLRDGFELDYNRRVLRENGLGFIESGIITNTAEMVQNGWVRRADCDLYFTREVGRCYNVGYFASIAGNVNFNNDFLVKRN